LNAAWRALRAAASGPSPASPSTETRTSTSGIASALQVRSQCAAQASASRCRPWWTWIARNPDSRSVGDAAQACSRTLESSPPLNPTSTGRPSWRDNTSESAITAPAAYAASYAP
jgi:hypothetical protein